MKKDKYLIHKLLLFHIMRAFASVYSMVQDPSNPKGPTEALPPTLRLLILTGPRMVTWVVLTLVLDPLGPSTWELVVYVTITDPSVRGCGGGVAPLGQAKAPQNRRERDTITSAQIRVATSQSRPLRSVAVYR